MGYRSEIAIAVSKENWDNAPEYVKNYIKVSGIEVIDTGNNVILYHDSLKWYEEYKAVADITNWYQSLGQDNFGFIRLGEDIDDNEFDGVPYIFGLGLQRSITF